MITQSQAHVNRSLVGYAPTVRLPIKNGIPVLLEKGPEAPPRFKFINDQLTKAHFKPILFEDDKAVYVRRISTPSQYTDHLFTLDCSEERGPRWILESYHEVLVESGKSKNWRAVAIYNLKDIFDMRFFVDYFGGLR